MDLYGLFWRMILTICFGCLLATDISAQTVKFWSAKGNDSNDGNTRNSAWRSVEKINSALAASGNNITEIVIDDTSGAIELTSPLVISDSARGLHLHSLTGGFADLRAYKVLAKNAFYQPDPVNYPRVWATSDSSQASVLWERPDVGHPETLVWYTKVNGAAYTPTVAAQLNATAGSFYTDDAVMYFNPLGANAPPQNTGDYVRSRYLGDGGFALLVTTDAVVENLKLGGMCLADKETGDGGAYAINVQHGTLTVIRDCYLYAWGRHAVGAIFGKEDGSLLVERVEAEQGTPYAQQTAFVSFNNIIGGANLNHTYRNCVVLKNAGLPGSSDGQNISIPVWLLHDDEQTRPDGKHYFRNLRIECSRFPRGRIIANGDVAPNGFVISHTLLGESQSQGTAMLIENSYFDTGLATAQANYTNAPIIVRGSVFNPQYDFLFESGGRLGYGYLTGNLTYENCTFDWTNAPASSPIFSGVPGYPDRALTKFRFVGNSVRLKNNKFSNVAMFNYLNGSLLANCEIHDNLYDINKSGVPVSITHSLGAHETSPESLPPNAPRGLTAMAANGQVNLSWAVSARATGYNIKRATASGGLYDTLDNDIVPNSYQDTMVTNGVTYYYVVSAVNDEGESPNSNEVSATPQGSPDSPAPPKAPTGLNVTVNNTKVSLAWSNSAGATSYKVFRSTSSGIYNFSVPLAKNLSATNYTDDAVVTGTTYYYVVRATNAIGDSLNSNQVSAMLNNTPLLFYPFSINHDGSPLIAGPLGGVSGYTFDDWQQRLGEDVGSTIGELQLTTKYKLIDRFAPCQSNSDPPVRLQKFDRPIRPSDDKLIERGFGYRFLHLILDL